MGTSTTRDINDFDFDLDDLIVESSKNLRDPTSNSYLGTSSARDISDFDIDDPTVGSSESLTDTASKS